jgi:XTP/dITP diphosphohydrolase
MSNEIVIATQNANKTREIKALLAGHHLDVKTLADFDQALEIPETGKTFAENALLKAQATVKLTQLPAIADDSGLMVDALNGEPGIYSARYAGDHDDAANNQKLLRNLKDVQTQERTAHFHTTMVALKPSGAKLVVDGDVAGLILESARGNNGFGYDPLFYVPELKLSMAEMTEEQKNSISHRGRALRNLLAEFKQWWDAQ